MDKINPVSDFDPLKMLEDLQRGFLALEANDTRLLDNQINLQRQLGEIMEIQRRLQARQDVIKDCLDLVIQAQKLQEDNRAK